MGWPEYGFAIFAFILAAALVVLNHSLKRSRQNAADLSKEKEKRLFQLYQNLEELINSAQDECENTLALIRRERQELNTRLEQARAQVEEETKNAPLLAPAQQVPESGNARDPLIFAQNVRKLSGDGLSEEKIAQELGASRGEVALLLGLQKR